MKKQRTVRGTINFLNKNGVKYLDFTAFNEEEFSQHYVAQYETLYNKVIVNKLFKHFDILPFNNDVDVKKDILDQINGAEGDEFFITDYTAPFTMGEYTSLTDLNKLAIALNDEEIDTLEDLYWYVIENCDISSTNLPYLYHYDSDDDFNRLMEDRTPIRIACSIGHLNTQDEYLYFDGYDNINSMDENAFQRMLTKSADDLINLFALDHEISSFK